MQYVYRPQSPEHRAKLAAVNRKRRGIPDGYHSLYGVHVPNKHFREIQRLTLRLRTRTTDREVLGWFIRVLVRCAPLLERDTRAKLLMALALEFSVAEAERETSES